MHSYDDFLCIIYILQIIIGVLGNSLLLYLYGSNSIGGQRTRPIGLIFINLAFSNILMILFRGVPWAIQSCTQKIFLGDIDCKIVVYLQRVSRGLSLCTTCLMSFFQAIMITFCSSKWLELKTRATQYIVPSCVFIWVLNLLVDVIVPLHVTGPRNSTNSMLSKNLGYCSINRYAMTTLKLVIWKSLYDAVFVAFMAITSGYMVYVLYRHHRKVQHIRDTPSASPEIRATKAILFLVSIFVLFYSISSIFIIVMDNSKDKNQWLIYISVCLTLCYPTVSPFVLISSDSRIPSCCNALKRMKMSYPHSSRSQNKLM
ncbi:vomeronasal type-1 receptor 4-like [Vombatus ursinus]|uniref:vomeronasal type-1 receptor 4-like n=1 Tax=Vombatus ursinus TaxID=29139 RepID=UPI000FFD9F8B|nr:vomeronasal type-1 receptor 4-like [Vombatus ursinus]